MNKEELTKQACDETRAQILAWSEKYAKGLITYVEYVQYQMDLIKHLKKELVSINLSM